MPRGDRWVGGRRRGVLNDTGSSEWMMKFQIVLEVEYQPYMPSKGLHSDTIDTWDWWSQKARNCWSCRYNICRSRHTEILLKLRVSKSELSFHIRQAS